MEWAENQHANAAQDSLFGDVEAQTPPDLVKAAEWGLKERLIQEKAALGLYLSGHPFDADRAALKGLVDRSLKDVKPQRELQLMAGTIASMRIQMTRRGKMASILLDDRSAQLEIAVFGELFDGNKALLKEDALLIVAGNARDDSYSGGMRVTAEEVMDIDTARTRFATGLKLDLKEGVDVRRLIDLLTGYKNANGCAVSLHYRNPQAECDVQLGPAWRLRLTEELFVALAEFGTFNVGYSVVLKSSRDRERAAA
jgi:DNA polymerase-3 subunit alpha